MTRHYYAAAFFLLLLSAATADDKVVMSALLSGLSSHPSGWSESTPYCQWTGVKCDASNRVTSLDLYDMHLRGTLPADLNKLSELKTLYLSQNVFSGAFPSLSGLASLEEAYLDGNRFDSAPPGFLKGLTSLRFLNLTDNPNLPPWSFPGDLSESRSLAEFNASNAGLTGPLPDIFGSFPDLRYLDLSRNNLTGPIPHTLAVLPRIYSLDLSHNNLTGTIPELPNEMIKKDFGNNPLLVLVFRAPSGFRKSLPHGVIIGLIAGAVFMFVFILAYVLYKSYMNRRVGDSQSQHEQES